MYEYEVVRISTMQKGIQSKEQSEEEEAKIKATVNELAGQGWRLISTSVHASDIGNFARATLMLFFERELSQSS